MSNVKISPMMMWILVPIAVLVVLFVAWRVLPEPKRHEMNARLIAPPEAVVDQPDIKPNFEILMLALDKHGKVIKRERITAPNMAEWHKNFLSMPNMEESAAFIWQDGDWFPVRYERVGGNMALSFDSSVMVQVSDHMATAVKAEPMVTIGTNNVTIGDA